MQPAVPPRSRIDLRRDGCAALAQGPVLHAALRLQRMLVRHRRLTARLIVVNERKKFQNPARHIVCGGAPSPRAAPQPCPHAPRARGGIAAAAAAAPPCVAAPPSATRPARPESGRATSHLLPPCVVPPLLRSSAAHACSQPRAPSRRVGRLPSSSSSPTLQFQKRHAAAAGHKCRPARRAHPPRSLMMCLLRNSSLLLAPNRPVAPPQTPHAAPSSSVSPPGVVSSPPLPARRLRAACNKRAPPPLLHNAPHAHVITRMRPTR